MPDSLRRILLALGLAADLHWLLFQIGVAGAMATVVGLLISAYLSLPSWAIVALALSTFLIVVPLVASLSARYFAGFGPWRSGVDTLIAWLYRRENWSGLSDEGRYNEGAPEAFGETIYRHLGIPARYKRPHSSVAEPGCAGGVRSPAEIEHDLEERWIRTDPQPPPEQAARSASKIAHRMLRKGLPTSPIDLVDCSCCWNGAAQDWEDHRRRAG